MLELDMIDGETMSEFELIKHVASSMGSIVYDALKSAHDHAISYGMTEAGADEAVRITIENMYNAMKEVDNGH